MGFMVNKEALGKVFYQYFGFLCQSFQRLLHSQHHPSLSGPSTKGYLVASVIVDSVRLHPKKKGQKARDEGVIL
jgi:hypothetical protein